MSQPLSIVIFGASGDLTWRKLIPALFSNYCKQRLPENFQIVGVSRSTFEQEEFREKVRDGAKEFASHIFSAKHWHEFAKHIWYVSGNATETSDYRTLDEFLREKEAAPANRLYYLSTAPSLYATTIDCLGAAGMVAETEGWRRVVIEKPFGYDLRSAQKLNVAIHQVLREDQIYRIDHYLGKETAQNILFFRFANTIFEPIWNRNYIDNIQISVTEQVDVGHRAAYYDQSGVIRDMFQNHLLQLLTLVAMEPPASVKADPLRNEKTKVLSSVRPVDLKDTVRGQYTTYRQAEDVANNSETPTYAALKLEIDNWRWQGVPFYLRSGKALANKTSEIVITFKAPPHRLFNHMDGEQLSPNVLSLCIQPNEGIHLNFETKVPDSMQETRSVDMDFEYDTYFGDDPLPDAYERLLLDAIKGDASLFTRSDNIEAAWQLIDPIIQGWESGKADPLAFYEPGSWGPAEADQLLAKSGHQWILKCGA